MRGDFLFRCEKRRSRRIQIVLRVCAHAILVSGAGKNLTSKPNAAAVYPELSPLVGRIQHQNRTIREQMEQLLQRQREFAAITENMSEGFLLLSSRMEVLTGAVILLLDVTEREKREALRREFSANVSHELKTPLTSISGYAELMKEGLLREMLYNLCDNAIKYNRDGGSVTVTVGHEDRHVRLSVRDTGIGIPYGEQARVFERFCRVDKSRSRRMGGTGLGLSIVKHCAQMHRAEIRLESEPDKGTEITIVF